MSGEEEAGRPDGSSLGTKLNNLLAEAGLDQLEPPVIEKFEAYLALLLRWNSRVNLTAIRDEDGILKRHFVESIACAEALPSGIVTLLDFGSGGGLPGIPIALCRPEITVTLAESNGKKAAFLQEAVRVVQIRARVYAGRAESLQERFDCVALRAVDRMRDAVAAAQTLVKGEGWLALLTSESDVDGLKGATGGAFSWRESIPMPGSDRRILALGRQKPQP